MTPVDAEVRRVVDLQVEEPREDERLLGSALHAPHLGDASALDDELARERALDRVNEQVPLKCDGFPPDLSSCLGSEPHHV